MGIECDYDRLHERVATGQTVNDEGDDVPIRFINAYEIDYGYGGAEEGGWWFTCGMPLASIPYLDPEQGKEAIEWLRRKYHDMYDDGRDISSVLHTGSLAIMLEDHMAKPFPSERPHYE